jgi:thiamine biosynthesis lipoprotein
MQLHPEAQSVELRKPNMRLDLGGIAKGYAVDEAMAALRKRGIRQMMVEAGGNIGLGDPPPGRSGWRIGIARPDSQSPAREYLELANVAISVSGDMWQYAIIGGKRYSHLVDPRTGLALTEHNSVTVVGPDGLSTDGVSSAAAILGPERGVKLIENSPGAFGLILRMVDGKEETFESKNWKELPRARETAPTE